MYSRVTSLSVTGMVRWSARTANGLAGGLGSGGQGCPVGNGESMGSLLVLAKAKCKALRTWSKAQPLWRLEGRRLHGRLKLQSFYLRAAVEKTKSGSSLNCPAWGQEAVGASCSNKSWNWLYNGMKIPHESAVQCWRRGPVRLQHPCLGSQKHGHRPTALEHGLAQRAFSAKTIQSHPALMPS